MALKHRIARILHTLIVGGAHPRKREYLEELKLKIREANLDSQITFTGNRDDLREILSISDLVLSLTRQPESFGRTTLEALAMGIPVAGYAHGGVVEQLEALLPAGKVPVSDIAAMASRLGDWYENPPQPDPENPFSLGNMLDHTFQEYKKLNVQST